MEISASVVKTLREKTGLGMMDCKQALAEANGDMELAIENLRKKGEVTAAKRADRAAKEGKVTIVKDDTAGMIYEVNSETDFVARNDDFIGFIDALGKAFLAQKPADHAAALQLTDASIGGVTVETRVTELVAKIGEKIMFRRYKKMDAEPGKTAVFSYIHGGGRIGVMVKLEGASAEALKSEAAAELGKDLAMQIAAASPAIPVAVSPESIPADVIAKEKVIYEAQAKESGKPEKIWDKIVEGKLTKYYDEYTLVRQKFIRDPDKSVADRITEASKAAGAELKPVCFVRFALGEEE